MMADRRVRTFGKCGMRDAHIELTNSKLASTKTARAVRSIFLEFIFRTPRCTNAKLLPNPKCWREITWPASTDRTMRLFGQK